MGAFCNRLVEVEEVELATVKEGEVLMRRKYDDNYDACQSLEKQDMLHLTCGPWTGTSPLMSIPTCLLVACPISTEFWTST